MQRERELLLVDDRASESHMFAALDTLGAWPRLALDTESDSFHRYFEKVCLIQLSTPEVDLIFDPLAHGLPEPLRRVLSAADRTMVLHGADYDVLSLKRSFELSLGKIFDTMIAARFVGATELGLKALLKNELGVEIEKGEQRSDWGRRPLSPSQLEYARQDTRYLHLLADRLSERLANLGRLGWVEEECALICERSPAPRSFDPESWWKVKGADQLPEVAQRAFRASFLWRDEVAQRKDRPPFKVVDNQVLLRIAQQIARQGSSLLDRLGEQPGLHPRLDLRSLARAIREGLGTSDPLRRPRTARGRRPAEAARNRAQRLKVARDEWASALGLEPALLMPQAMIDAVAHDLPSDKTSLARTPGMTRWRTEAIGGPILDLLTKTG